MCSRLLQPTTSRAAEFCTLQFGDKEGRYAEQESVRIIESCNHQGIYYLNRSFLRQTRPVGSDVPQVIVFGAAYVLYVTNHRHFGIICNADVVSTGTGDDVTVADLDHSRQLGNRRVTPIRFSKAHWRSGYCVECGGHVE